MSPRAARSPAFRAATIPCHSVMPEPRALLDDRSVAVPSPRSVVDDEDFVLAVKASSALSRLATHRRRRFHTIMGRHDHEANAQSRGCWRAFPGFTDGSATTTRYTGAKSEQRPSSDGRSALRDSNPPADARPQTACTPTERRSPMLAPRRRARQNPPSGASMQLLDQKLTKVIGVQAIRQQPIGRREHHRASGPQNTCDLANEGIESGTCSIVSSVTTPSKHESGKGRWHPSARVARESVGRRCQIDGVGVGVHREDTCTPGRRASRLPYPVPLATSSIRPSGRCCCAHRYRSVCVRTARSSK